MDGPLAGEGRIASLTNQIYYYPNSTEKLMIESLFCSIGPILVIFAKSACADCLLSSLYLIIDISSRKKALIALKFFDSDIEPNAQMYATFYLYVISLHGLSDIGLHVCSHYVVIKVNFLRIAIVH